MIVFCFYFKLIEPEWADRSLVSSEVKISTRLENSEFISLLRSAGFLYPDHEHVYWRIGATMTLNELDYFRDKSKSQSAISYENGANILIHGVKIVLSLTVIRSVLRKKSVQPVFILITQGK